jgi:glucose-1-phosphate adenylyltransferase
MGYPLRLEGVVAQSVRNCPRRRRGQATDAPHRRSRQARRSLCRSLPPGGFRDFEPDQLKPASSSGAHSVQVPFARPSRVSNVAFKRDAQRLRRLGSCPTKARKTLVCRLCGCHLPKLIGDEKPDLVVVVGADHVYRMDFQQMIEAHLASGAGVTVAGIRQPREMSDQFGVITTGSQHPDKITAFTEKPKNPEGLPDSPDEVLASMGNYVFTTKALVESDHDMGGDIIPAFVERGEAYVYDLNRNKIPGARENDRFYWRDVGTIDAFFDAHQDLISIDPAFNLFNADWPIYSQQWNSPPAKFVQDQNGNPGSLSESTVSLGCYVVGAKVSRSVLGPWVNIDSGAVVEDSILFERVVVGAGAHIHRAILDKDVVLEPGAKVGIDQGADKARGFTRSEGGVTVVEKGTVVRA